MATQNSEVTTENLLDAVVQMPKDEFESFVEKARLLRNGEETPSEADLLHKINTIYSAEKRKRYNALYAKFKEENISEKEYKELLELSNEFELLDAERLRYIGKLATIRGQDLEDVIKDLKAENPQK